MEILLVLAVFFDFARPLEKWQVQGGSAALFTGSYKKVSS
jgi:hypothetical protein